jgi:superfamily II DNA or RNA helicase
MPPPTDIQGEFDVKNGFYNINVQRTEELRAAIAALAHAVNYVEGQHTAVMGADNIGAVTKALVRIEVAKIDDMARVAAFSLRANPNCKVILCLNYLETIAGLAQNLAEYSPLVLTGSTKKHHRSPIINAFNGDLTYRVLIMNTRVGGVGISLHDVDGDKPRVMIMSPSYKVIDIAQAAARIYRAGTKSDAHVRMFYGKNTGNETNILSAMAKKTATLKGTFAEGVNRDMLLPGDYPSEMEP